MITPIELHFYNKRNEIIRTYSQSVIKWSFFKKAVSLANGKAMDETNIDAVYEFVRSFYENRFTVRKLKKHTDIEQVLAVAGQIVNRVLTLMKHEGVEFPNVKTAEKKKKSRILCRMIGFLRSKE